jgi:hypothetical protein
MNNVLTIPIVSTKDKIFEQYLTIVNPIFGKNRLSKIEIKVLAKLLQVKSLYDRLGPELCNQIIFHTETKKRICDAISKELNCIYSNYSLNNVLRSLRKKDIIKDNKIELAIPMKDGRINILFNLSVENE